MFEKILNATDFSDVSKKALDYLAQLKEAGQIIAAMRKKAHMNESIAL